MERVQTDRGKRPEAVDFSGVTPVSGKRVSDEVSEQIRNYIMSEKMAEGARIPSERELARLFNASRPTISQALRHLALLGLVEIRRGSGVYVLRRPENMVATTVNLMLDFDKTSIADLMQLRLWLETIGAEQAASLDDDARTVFVESLSQALAKLVDSARVPSRWIASDTVFHAELVRGAGNSSLSAMYESVHTTILKYEYELWLEDESSPFWINNATAEEQMELHAPIVSAIAAGSLSEVNRAVRIHHEAMMKHVEAAQRHEEKLADVPANYYDIRD
jgi:GntR family transcriptional repressor for pyruvate dehydrogenase complex